MRYRLRRVLDSFWFVPGLGLLLALVVAEALVAVEPVLPVAIDEILPAVGPDGSRGLLSAIATSMLAAAATTFSITIAVLTLTSSAYGPRLVRSLMADRGNQVVLALLVSTSLFAMLVVRHVRAGADSEFVPHLAVNVAIVLAVASIVALVYFIHHISASIQISRLASGVRAQLVALLDDLYPERGAAGRAPAAQWATIEGGAEVRARASGYVASIDHAHLVSKACAAGARVELRVRPGTLVCAGDPIARVSSSTAPSTGPQEAARLKTAVLAAISIDDERTPVQDAEHLVRQLVDVAARALSPGVNDPITALTAIDALTIALASAAGRPDPSRVLLDDAGAPRLLVAPRELSALAVDAVDIIRQYVGDQPLVAHRLLDLLERLIAREGASGGVAAARTAAYRDAGDRVARSAIGPGTLAEDAAALERRRATIVQGGAS
ncbi:MULTISPECIES: DUF2254 domain-containing protein [unclassified Microcella]|uniref:DUF2254 domain-containing protein n=1 Tax=unclassified Microcella TaxID=2630066 RepID=UPI001F3E8508|nr:MULTISPECIES: DUF2254 domain-containing protein [unclassified Microcella]